MKALGKGGSRQTLDFHEFTLPAIDQSKDVPPWQSEPSFVELGLAMEEQAQRGLFEVILKNFLIFTLRWLRNDLDSNKGTETSSPNSGTKSHRSTTSTTT